MVVVFKTFKRLWQDTSGDAIVEATFLFPLIILVFAALVILSMYLPTQASLQRVTQVAATAVATEMSDTWLTYNQNSLEYVTLSGRHNLPSVYSGIFNLNRGMYEGKAVTIANNALQKNIGARLVTPQFSCTIRGFGAYKEVTVTATQSVPISRVVNLTIIGFPASLDMVVSSSAVVIDGDEFIRSLDLALDFKDSVLGLFGNITDLISRFGLW